MPEQRDNYSPYNPATGWGMAAGTAPYIVAALRRIADCVCAAPAAALPQVATPTFDPISGGYELPFTITISTETEDAEIHYTLDGTDPDANSPLYDPDAPLMITQDSTIKAIGIKLGYLNSEIGSAAYTIEFPQAAAPIFSPAAGDYAVSQLVTITSPNGGTIYYTTDGSVPDSSDTAYSGPITVSANTTFRAIAIVTGFDDSAVTNAAYTITPLVVATPTFSPSTGAFDPTVNVTITTATSGATIYYTTDGSAPDETDFLYSGPVLISATTTIKAKAFKASYTASSVATKTYTLTPVGDPVTIYYGSSLATTVAETQWDTEFGSAGSPSVETYADWTTLDYFYLYDTTIAAGGTANGPYRYFIMTDSEPPPNPAASGGFFTTLNLNTSDLAGVPQGYTDTDSNGWPCLNVTRTDLSTWRVYRLKNALNGTVDLRVRAH